MSDCVVYSHVTILGSDALGLTTLAGNEVVPCKPPVITSPATD